LQILDQLIHPFDVPSCSGSTFRLNVASWRVQVVLKEVVDSDWCLLFSGYLVVHSDVAGTSEAVLLVVESFDGDGLATSNIHLLISKHVSVIPSIQHSHQIIRFQHLLLLSLFLLLVTHLILILQIVLFSLNRRLKLHTLLVFAFFDFTEERVL
jgi:hypothetical protein